jgi:hypothetical protein
LRLAVLFAALSCACVEEEPVTLRCARVDADDVRDARNEGLRAAIFPDGAARALVREDTLVRAELDAPPPPVEPASGTVDEALLDMWDRSDASYELTTDDLAFGVDDVVLVPAFDVPRNAAPDDPAWAELRARYGQAPFVVESGPIGFSCDDDALFYVAKVCGVGCTTTTRVHLLRVAGAWRFAP